MKIMLTLFIAFAAMTYLVPVYAATSAVTCHTLGQQASHSSTGNIFCGQ